MATTTSKVKRGKRISDPVEREAFKAQRREEERQAIEASVRALMASEGWARWIEARQRFHTYSLCNTLLIAQQMPSATQVAGYKVWQSLGRQVRKGEHGIRIMAPMTVKRSKDRAAGQAWAKDGYRPRAAAADNETETLTLFRAVSVFDVSQTDGDDLPACPREPIEGDSHAEYLPKLEAFAGELGYAVEYEDLGARIGGYCNPETKVIAINTRSSVNGQVRTFVHELAHALGVDYVDYSRADAEVIVECAAIIACGSLGLDTSGESVPYVAGWGHKSDLDAMRTHAAKVDECAGRIERALGVR